MRWKGSRALPADFPKAKAKKRKQAETRIMDSPGQFLPAVSCDRLSKGAGASSGKYSAKTHRAGCSRGGVVLYELLKWTSTIRIPKGAKTSVGALVGSAIVIAIFILVVLGITLWSKNLQDTAALSEEAGTGAPRSITTESQDDELPVETKSQESTTKSRRRSRVRKASTTRTTERRTTALNSTNGTTNSTFETAGDGFESSTSTIRRDEPKRDPEPADTPENKRYVTRGDLEDTTAYPYEETTFNDVVVVRPKPDVSNSTTRSSGGPNPMTRETVSAMPDVSNTTTRSSGPNPMTRETMSAMPYVSNATTGSSGGPNQMTRETVSAIAMTKATAYKHWRRSARTPTIESRPASADREPWSLDIVDIEYDYTTGTREHEHHHVIRNKAATSAMNGGEGGRTARHGAGAHRIRKARPETTPRSDSHVSSRQHRPKGGGTEENEKAMAINRGRHVSIRRHGAVTVKGFRILDRATARARPGAALADRPEHVRVYHCTSGTLQQQTWAEVTPTTQELIVRHPLPHVMRFPRVSLTNNPQWHNVNLFCLHYLPACVGDLALQLIVRKPWWVLGFWHQRYVSAVDSHHFYSVK
ncbi:hypothetical protein HPB48_016145 [Haemaphysalis longicornis]|uniref:Uncharacterized protein n=1 Tax=Haemaphysalis longicornis TaxID=44386 RepID=A0A9J6GG91_HAELO|nr:hypothetical protein HPB48_016145 [Haemaphysalis longicornis]